MRAARPRSILGARLLGVLLFLSALAGCASHDPPTALATTTTDPSSDPDARFSLTGRVQDDELRGIPDAKISLSRIERETRSNAEGEFAVDNLVAGDYDLQVEKAGFKSRRQRVTVLDQVEPTAVKIQLEPVPISRERVQTLSLHGLVACSVSYTEPTVFPDEYSVCRNIPQTMDKTFLDFRLDEGVGGLLVETVWTESTPLAKNLKVRVQKGPGGGAFTDGPLIGESRGPSVLRLEIPTAGFKEAAARGIDCMAGCNLTSMTASSPALGTAADAGLAIQEEFEQWLSIYYWQDAPPGASALPNTPRPQP